MASGCSVDIYEWTEQSRQPRIVDLPGATLRSMSQSGSRTVMTALRGLDTSFGCSLQLHTNVTLHDRSQKRHRPHPSPPSSSVDTQNFNLPQIPILNGANLYAYT